MNNFIMEATININIALETTRPLMSLRLSPARLVLLIFNFSFSL